MTAMCHQRKNSAVENKFWTAVARKLGIAVLQTVVSICINM